MTIEYRTYLRPVYEAKAAVVWIISAIWCLAIAAVFNIGIFAGISLVALCVGMGLWRGYKGRDLVERKLALVGSSVEILPVKSLLASMPA